MRTRRTDTLIGLALTVALVAAGCGGGSSKTGTGSPTGGNAGVELPAIQVQHQSAFALLDAAGWSAAIGDAVTAIEDDLIAPGDCGSDGAVSSASTITASGDKFVVFLFACDTEANAQSFASQIGSPAPTVVVQQCTKVLNVRPSLGPDAQAALNSVKENGGDPTVAIQESDARLTTEGTKLADALKAKLSCEPGKRVYEIPAGGADPCDIASLTAAVGEPVTVTHQPASRNTPGVSCRVSPKTQAHFSLTLSCDAQLKKAVPPTESNARFATDQHNSGSRAQPVTDGGIEAFKTVAIFETKLRTNNTLCALVDETEASGFDDASIAIALKV
ncbi:MAG: hypothetical protein QOG30_1573, partial [Acidimicrobiaceae bacterium]